jgi:hypothetical protein
MRGYVRFAALLAAGLLNISTLAQADETRLTDGVATDATIFETSARVRYGWTEMAFRGDRPKAWDESMSPEFRASLRVLSGLFEGKIEIGALADRYVEFDRISTDSLRGELQLGVNTGAWSYLAEWKPRDVFVPGYKDFLVGLNMYDARVRNRFSADLFAGLPSGLFQATVAVGYVASTPHLYARNFAELELEMVQRFGGGFALMVAPKLELSDYLDFDGRDRKDAALSLRLIPTYSFGGGVTLSVEGQATVALSTLDNKTGETWSLTPILRLQKSL